MDQLFYYSKLLSINYEGNLPFLINVFYYYMLFLFFFVFFGIIIIITIIITIVFIITSISGRHSTQTPRINVKTII